MKKSLRNFFFDESPVFLKKNLNFLATILVLATTLLGWFNSNSWTIILLVACRLFCNNPFTAIKTAFSDKLFLAFLVFFLIDVSGYFHTHNLATQGTTITKELTLVAIAFVFCAGPFADQRTYRQLITSYSLLLLAVSLYCLTYAVRRYIHSQDSTVFFYHDLTSPISYNAVFFSAYVLFGIIFLLSPQGEPAIGWLPRTGRKVMRYALVLFFLGMIVLLSSRLLMTITLLILINAFSRRYSYRKNKRTFLVAGSALLIGVCLLIVIDNPIRARFRDMAGDLKVVQQEKFNPKMYFNSLQSRLVEYRFAFEILKAKNAWIFGVSPGDSQDLLNQKYIDADMDIGIPAEGPNRKLRGFIGFNFHNQFVETWVRTGLVGLASLLAIFILLIARTRQHGAKENWFIILTIAFLFIPEAPMTLQHGVFLFCFFPLLALSAPGVARVSSQ
jgi:O-antigen ligase